MIPFLFLIALTAPGIRSVSASSCDVTDVKLSAGMSTLLEFDEEPQLTFHADDQHFLLKSHESAKRALVILPRIKETDIRQIFPNEENRTPGTRVLAEALDRNFRTNLFVFFKGERRLMFRLRFVEKAEADYVLRVKEIFKRGCSR